jgi:quinol monooxygenase YgiN
VALNKSIAPAPQSETPLLINVDEIDVADGQRDKFVDAAKTHAAASVQDPGCREFNITVLQTRNSHLLLLSAFDDVGALAAHQASDHYKAYQAATKGIVSKSTTLPLSSVVMLTKGQ